MEPRAVALRRACRPGDGHRACRRGWRRTAVHRQKLSGMSRCCGLVPERGERVAPGGKSLRVSIERLEQQGNNELGVNPPFGRIGIFMRQVAQLEQLFEPLEGQFHLPAEAVQLKDLAGGQQAFGQGREEHDEVARLQRARLKASAFFLGLLQGSALGLRRERSRKPEQDYATSERRSAWHLHANLARLHLADPERHGMVKGVKAATLRVAHRCVLLFRRTSRWAPAFTTARAPADRK